MDGMTINHIVSIDHGSYDHIPVTIQTIDISQQALEGQSLIISQ